jgi:uncharacterized protein YkwD
VFYLACLLLAGCAPNDNPNRSRGAADPPTSPEQREALVFRELNELRANPAAYAARIEARLPFYTGNVLQVPGSPAIQTVEGRKAAEEAIAALRSAEAVEPVELSPGLALAAHDHVRDIGPKGLVAHEGSGGTTTPEQRVARYAKRYNYVGENISFGPERPRDVIMDLLIDDNVPDRGHRATLLNPRFRFAGVACGHHAVYRMMCVIDFTGEYVERSLGTDAAVRR